MSLWFVKQWLQDPMLIGNLCNKLLHNETMHNENLQSARCPLLLQQPLPWLQGLQYQRLRETALNNTMCIPLTDEAPFLALNE
jgi:hypothetical protein